MLSWLSRNRTNEKLEALRACTFYFPDRSEEEFRVKDVNVVQRSIETQ